MVFLRPVSRSIFEFPMRVPCARSVMSGQRCIGSSTGSGRVCTIFDLPFTSLQDLLGEMP